MLLVKRALVAILFFGIAGAFWYWVNDLRKYLTPLPEPAIVFDASNFTGRILPNNKVHPGTFSIVAPADQINGKDAILSYGHGGSEIWASSVWLTFWKPDPTTPNVFLKGQMEKSASEIWGQPFVMVEKVEKTILTNNALTAHPRRNIDLFIGKSALLALATIIFSILMWILIGATTKIREDFNAIQNPDASM